MSEYLRNLQESVIIQHSFIRSRDFMEDIVIVTESELKIELDGIFEDEESLDDFIFEFITEDTLSELNTGALKSLQHLMGVYDKQLSNMTHDSVDRPRLLAKMTGVQNKINAVEQAGRDAAKAAKEAAKAAKDTVQDKAVAVADKTKEVASTAVDKTKEVASTVTDTAKEVSSDAAEKVSGVASKAGEYISQNPGTSAAIAAGAAAAIGAGILAYKKFFSKGARACKNASDKKDCMKDLKKKAMTARISAMNAGKAKCAGHAKCIAKIDKKVSDLKYKMESI